MRLGEEGSKSFVNSQLFSCLPHLTGSNVTYCDVDRVKRCVWNNLQYTFRCYFIIIIFNINI